MKDDHPQKRGTCRQCRHANHETDDAAEGLWACPWLGATAPDRPCRIQYRETGAYVFEQYDGANCTWGTGNPIYREVPAGYENRPVAPAGDEPADPLRFQESAFQEQSGWSHQLARFFRRLFR